MGEQGLCLLGVGGRRLGRNPASQLQSPGQGRQVVVAGEAETAPPAAEDRPTQAGDTGRRWWLVSVVVVGGGGGGGGGGGRVGGPAAQQKNPTTTKKTCLQLSDFICI